MPAVTAILTNLPVVDFAILRPDQQTAYTLRVPDPYTTLSVMRSEVEAWLAWKAAVDGWWVRVGVTAAIIAAGLAALSWTLPLLPWLRA